eukprot:1869315-Rhodomonas_salina.1
METETEHCCKYCVAASALSGVESSSTLSFGDASGREPAVFLAENKRERRTSTPSWVRDHLLDHRTDIDRFDGFSRPDPGARRHPVNVIGCHRP